MKRNLGSILCFCAIGVFSLLCGAASAQTSSTTTVAYVYVANSAGGNQTEISAFAADSTGRLRRVPGSPYVENAGYMVTNGKYLMSVSGSNINAYRIANNGSLTFAVSTDYQRVKPTCGAANQLVFDHTGQSLYLTEYDVDCANNGVTDWSVDSATGGLNYLGMTNTGNWNVNAAYFIHNNEFAYTAYNDNCMYFSMNGFKRAANGTITEFGPKFNSPAPPSGIRTYIPYLGAADPANHIAFAEYPANPPGCSTAPVQLATYTSNADGSLTTTSTAKNMPATSIASIYDMKMSPSGKLLAVAGQQGLQVFHFNGAAPITHYTGLLTKDPINQMFWDNANHLYAITGVFNSNVNRLHVYTITPTGYREAPGSPYTLNGPKYITVQPWPRY
ncbi:MAG TPA: hypothetical protein VGT04_11920 [Acidobacteriaceae bacterium]|nr:hypothetical protein [Acidobacteriaceae bacterium]